MALYSTFSEVPGAYVHIYWVIWNNQLYAIQPIQQFKYTVGKNATDSAMIIDAMDLLHSNDVGGFCIVSSDSDYTRLATRIREEGLFVIGVGEKKTPEAFTNACNQFVYCENLTEPKENKKKTKEKEKADMADPMPLLLKAFEMVAKEEEWINLAAMGIVLHQLDPAFDPRTFGHNRLLSLIGEYPESFTIKRDNSITPTGIYIARQAQKPNSYLYQAKRINTELFFHGGDHNDKCDH